MKRIELSSGDVLFISNSIRESRDRIVELFEEGIKNCLPFDILVPVYLDTKGKIFYHGGNFTSFEKLPVPEAQAEEWRNQYPNPRYVDFSPLWAFVVKKESLSKIPKVPEFDKDIFEHADFVVQCRKKGLKICVHPNIKITYKFVYTKQSKNIKLQKIFKNSYNKFVEKHGKWLDKQYRLPVMFHTHTGYPGGYCIHARSILKALSKKKIKIYYKFIGGANDDEPVADDFIIDDLRNDMGSHHLPQVALSSGLNLFSNSGDYKIGYTTTEVDGIPQNWVRVLNEMDEVWTTSKFSKEAFKNSGVKRPIFVMYEGVDPNYFHPEIIPWQNNTKRKFVFFSNFAWGRRKGVQELFEAFSKEFSYKEDVVLVIKALPSYFGEDIRAHIRDLYYEPDSAPIIVWDTIIDPYLLGGFYTAGNCLVFPTRGEGFGLPPIEALSCGTPVITTDYSAPPEYLRKNGKVLPGVELIKPKITKYDGSDSIYYYGFNWALPSVADLRRKMRKVYNNYEKYKAGAMESSKYIRKEWSWDKAADKIIKRLEYIYKHKLK